MSQALQIQAKRIYFSTCSIAASCSHKQLQQHHGSMQSKQWHGIILYVAAASTLPSKAIATQQGG